MSAPQPPTTTAATPPPSNANANAGVAPGATADASRAPKPRVAIQYCTQCKWMLRAAYFAQELLSTFSTDLQEVSLVPCTGGIFTVTIYHSPTPGAEAVATQLWDRKTNGGFPEVKVLKSLVRNVVDPGRSLGHTDRALKGHGASTSSDVQPAGEVQGQGQGQGQTQSQPQPQPQPQTQTQTQAIPGQECEDCR